MKKRAGSFLAIFFFFLNIIIPPAVSGQGIMVLGEIRSSGQVFIESSGGQWIPAGKTYPILQNTSIKTEKGTASLSFREGSRADISNNSAAVVDGTPAKYSLYLSKGVVAFNVAADASLYISTPSGSAAVNGRNGIVQKVSLEKGARTLGIVSVSDKGTEVRSISGRIVVNVSPAESRLISSGETMSIDLKNTYRVYKTQAIVKIGRDVDYKIRVDDMLEVKTPTVEGYYRVDADGKITLSNNSVFKVEGLTPAEVEALLVKSLGTDPPSTFVYVVNDKDIPFAGAAGAGAAGGAAATSGEVVAAAAIGGLYATTVTVISFDVWRGPGSAPAGGTASPSGFRIR